MPCYDGRTNEQYYKEILDERTAQLCLTLKFLQSSSIEIYNKLPDSILNWHKEHKKFDENRQSN